MPNIAAILKDVISIMFKDELKLMNQLTSKFLQIKDQQLVEYEAKRLFGIVEKPMNEREIRKVYTYDAEI